MSQSAVPRPVIERQSSLAEIPVRNEATSSGISWAAVIGGAFVSASLALILLALGTGFGFSSVSPWSNLGASASTVGKGAVVWLILTQVLASAMGGYLASRLRTKWTDVHTDEVFFRDTAHGLLVWAVGMVITASLLASAATSLAGAAAQQSTNATTATTGASDGMLNPNAYFVDTLLPVSYTHLDVYKRQVWHLSAPHQCGTWRGSSESSRLFQQRHFCAVPQE